MNKDTHSRKAQGVYTTKTEEKDTNRPVSLAVNATIASSVSSDSDSDVTLYFTILEGRVSPADFTAAASAALLPFALDQEGPAPLQISASSVFVVALCFAIPGGRASPLSCFPGSRYSQLPGLWMWSRPGTQPLPQCLRFSIVFACRGNGLNLTRHTNRAPWQREEQSIGVRPLLAISYVALLKPSHIAFQCPWRSAFECLVDVPLHVCIMLLQARLSFGRRFASSASGTTACMNNG